MRAPFVCIDPGHGGSDPGACGNGLQEKNIALIVSSLARDYLVAAGCQVAMTRETDIDVAYPNASDTEELQARCNVSDQFGADIFVSIHCNAVDNPAAHGTETFYYFASTHGVVLATCIQEQIIMLGDLIDRGIKNNPLYVTGHTAAVAALVELAFISHTNDAAKLADPVWQDAMARAIACGITDYWVRINAQEVN